MTTEDLQKRQQRAETETFVIAKTTEGFRVCSPLNPASQYVVTGIPDAPRCTCPDYQQNEGDHLRCPTVPPLSGHAVVLRRPGQAGAEEARGCGRTGSACRAGCFAPNDRALPGTAMEQPGSPSGS
jgi:hypothetical protein